MGALFLSKIYRSMIFLIQHTGWSDPILEGVKPASAFFVPASFYLGSNFKSMALMATITVERDMRTAPKAGPKVMPIGARRPAAIGIAIKL